jgi:hypothetical protein
MCRFHNYYPNKAHRDSPTEPRMTQPRKTQPQMDWTLNGLSLEWTQPRMDWTPNGLNPKCTDPRLDWTPNGPNSEWTEPRMYWTPNGLNSEWTELRIDSTPTGTQHQMDSNPTGTQPRLDWTQPRMVYIVKDVYIKRMHLKRDQGWVSVGIESRVRTQPRLRLNSEWDSTSNGVQCQGVHISKEWI